MDDCTAGRLSNTNQMQHRFEHTGCRFARENQGKVIAGVNECNLGKLRACLSVALMTYSSLGLGRGGDWSLARRLDSVWNCL